MFHSKRVESDFNGATLNHEKQETYNSKRDYRIHYHINVKLYSNAVRNKYCINHAFKAFILNDLL